MTDLQAVFLSLIFIFSAIAALSGVLAFSLLAKFIDVILASMVELEKRLKESK